MWWKEKQKILSNFSRKEKLATYKRKTFTGFQTIYIFLYWDTLFIHYNTAVTYCYHHHVCSWFKQLQLVWHGWRCGILSTFYKMCSIMVNLSTVSIRFGWCGLLLATKSCESNCLFLQVHAYSHQPAAYYTKWEVILLVLVELFLAPHLTPSHS